MKQFQKTGSIRTAHQRQIPIVLKETAEHFGFEYLLALESSSSPRTGYIYRGIQSSVNRAGKEFPQNRTGEYQDSVDARKVTNFIWKVGHFDGNIGQIKALNFGRSDINFKRRKGIRNIVKERQYRKDMYLKIRAKI